MTNRKLGLSVILAAVIGGAAPGSAQSVVEATVPIAKPAPLFTGGPVSFFGTVTYGTQKDSRPGHGRDDTFWQPQAGVSWRFSQYVSVNVGGNYNSLDGDKFNPGGKYRLRGYSLFGGLTFYLDNYYLILTGGHVHSDIDESTVIPPTTIFNSRTQNGSFFDAILNGTYQIERWRLQPMAEFLYYGGAESASFNSDGSFRPRDPDSLGRLSVGGEVYRGVNIDDFYFEPMVHMMVESDTKLLRDYHDRTAVELGGGFNIPIGQAGTTLALRYYAVVGRDFYENDNFEISLYHQF